jgi:hypothetical protein
MELSASSEGLVGCQAAFASRLAPTEKQKHNSANHTPLLLLTTQQDER